MSQVSAQTPLHHWHVTHGARIMEKGGWQLPEYYSSVDEEVAAARQGPALVDVSAFAKIAVLGPGVSAYVRALLGDSPVAKPKGVARLSTPAPILACRLATDHLLFFAETMNVAGLQERLEPLKNEHEIIVSDATTAYAGFCLIGAHAQELLGQLTSLDVSETALPPGTCAETSLVGVHALLLRPAASANIHIYVPWDLGEFVWETLLESGRSSSIRPIGMAAWETLNRSQSPAENEERRLTRA